MAGHPKKPKPEEIETVPDAWDRFGNAVDVLAKTPPKYKKARKGEGQAGARPSMSKPAVKR